MKAYMNAYEENGKFYFEDDQAKVQTTELIDTDAVEYDGENGYSYNGKPMDAYIIE